MRAIGAVDDPFCVFVEIEIYQFWHLSERFIQTCGSSETVRPVGNQPCIYDSDRAMWMCLGLFIFETHSSLKHGHGRAIMTRL